jgi:hypothetical protein
MFKRLVKDLVEEFLEDWEDVETKRKVQERFFDPVINYLMDRMYPYLLVSATVVFLLTALSIMILFLLVRR